MHKFLRRAKFINPLGHKTILRPSAEGWFYVLRWNDFFYFFFQANFDAPLDLIQGKNVFLNCEGLDTVATVTLNNVEIGRAENMFRRYRFRSSHILVFWFLVFW